MSLRLEKGEELYALISQWSQSLLANCLPFLMVMRGRITMSDALDINSKNPLPAGFQFERIEMLIDVYFPSARYHYEKCIAARTALNRVYANFDQAARNSSLGMEAHIDPYVSAQNDFNSASSQLKKSVRDELRSLAYS
jgi:hypothetical protein